ncbi:ABC transporter permease [Desulfomonile tiedjei]|uniref:ABC-type multidrug transport system, permease component n=1 Tax=Desulfomonile tiedjei (strain ATCC 49306 / DSM 6799 / DCB-1) TaxID=706587 RepID=I4CA48_DESTA|nr:ABC transporter permease [Desulfomonile tiedjei]AFM26439.1 ABC-type multidrug transport system, permease component [Desulfomonile tiedjei DSM 6799]
MKEWQGFSPARLWAMVVKEFIQMRRDRLTFGMMVGIPLLQLILFGYAINSDPKQLPSAVLLADNGPQGRTLLYAIQNSGYFHFVRQVKTEEEGREALARGEVQFVINIPENFSRDLLRGDKPAILIEADATDPGTTSNAIGSLNALLTTALQNDLKGPLSFLAGTSGPVELRVHALYNPEVITQYNIVPGLLGVVLTMTMVMITALAITRERESGTMENLLSMPPRPVEVLIGKIIPYILVGYIQVALILLAGHFLFGVPMQGSLTLLLTVTFLFIVANLAMGVTFSTIAENQRQAIQMAFFFFLPNILLSGFAFSFRGMPDWAQMIGELLPLTHFLRIVRGILLKGNGVADVVVDLWQIGLFTVIALAIGAKRYRRTLD